MADSVKNLLARWDIDTSSWNSAIQSIRAKLQQMDAEDKARSVSNKALQEAAVAAVKSELQVREALTQANAKDLTSLKHKLAIAKSIASAQSQASKTAIDAIKAQTVAEQRQAEIRRAAVSIQQQASKNALAFEDAYQTKLQDSAKAKAKASAIFDAAYRAQVSEVQRNKTLNPQPQSAAAEYSSAPIVTPDKQKNIYNPGSDPASNAKLAAAEATAEANAIALSQARADLAKANTSTAFRQSVMDKQVYKGVSSKAVAQGQLDTAQAVQSESQQRVNTLEAQYAENLAAVRAAQIEVATGAKEAADAAIAGNSRLEASTTKVAEQYRALAAAQMAYKDASDSVAKTRKNIQTGNFKGTPEEASNAMAGALASQVQAKADLAKKQAQSEAVILKLKQAQADANTKALGQEAELIRLKEEEANVQRIAEAKQNLQNQYAYAEKSKLYRSLFKYDANKNYLSKPTAEVSSGGNGIGTRGAGLGIGQGREDKDFFDFLAGRKTMGPLQVFTQKLKGLQPLINAAFPVIGGLMFAQMLAEVGTAVYNLYTKIRDFKATSSNIFGGSLNELQQQNDELAKQDDEIKKSIALIEHKPVNGMAIALDDLRIKADQVYQSALKAKDALMGVLETGGVDRFFGLATGKANTKDIDLSMRPLEQTRINAAQEYEIAAHNLKAKTTTVKGKKGEKDTQVIDPETQRAFDKAKAALLAATKAEMDYADAQTRDLKRRREGKDLTTGEKIEDFIGPSLIPGGFGGGLATQDQSDRQRVLDYIKGRGKLLTTNIETTDTKDADQQHLQDDENKQRAAAQAMQEANARSEALKAISQDEYEKQKLDIQKLQDANETAYKAGDVASQAYYRRKNELSNQNLVLELRNIKTGKDADLEALKQRRVAEHMTPETYKYQKQHIEASSATRTDTAIYQTQREQEENNIGATEAARRVTREAIQADLDATVKAFEVQTEDLKSEYSEQIVDAQDYLSKMLALAAKTRDAKLASIEVQEFINGPNSPENEILNKQRIDTVAEFMKTQQGLLGNAPQQSFQYLQSRYQEQKSVFSAQEDLQNAPGVFTEHSQKQDLNQQQQLAAQQQLESLRSLLSTQTEYSKTWFEIYAQILSVNVEMAKLAQQQKDLSTSVPQMGSTLAAGVGAASGVFTSRYAKGLESSLSAAAQSNQQAPGFAQGILNGPWISRSIASANTDEYSSSDTTSKMDIGGTIDNFAKHLTSAVGAIGSFISAINSAGSASAGGIAGGFSGAGLGNSLGSSLGQEGGPLSGMGAMAGPFGALIGGAMGAALGAITGQKQEMVQDDINRLSANFKSIMNSYSANNSSLAQTVINLQQLIAQAEEQEASTKKGGSQFKQLIQQYNEQIQQLEDQQAQVMAQLQQQLVQVSSPEAYQPLIQSIQQVLQQYTSFVGAAQSASDLANANNFLTTSLQNLATSYNEQLQQNQEKAIQDALDLNNLYNQRNQLEYQYLQQVMSIQGQGTLTRTITSSQSKYSQLYNLDVNHANALDQINQQINVQQYRVQAESQIFQMAQTKAGLEQQMLQLQEQGINLDMARIAAMQNVLVDLQKTGYSIVGNLGSINPSDPNALMTLLLQILAQQLGVTSGSSGTNLTGASASSYIQQASQGYSATRGTNL